MVESFTDGDSVGIVVVGAGIGTIGSIFCGLGDGCSSTLVVVGSVVVGLVVVGLVVAGNGIDVGGSII